MIDIIGYGSNVESVRLLIHHLREHIYCPSKGNYEVIFFRYENGRRIVLDEITDHEYISNYKQKCKLQLTAALEVLGYATIHQQHLYKVSNIDFLKNKCYKYLEVMLSLERGVISKGD